MAYKVFHAFNLCLVGSTCGYVPTRTAFSAPPYIPC